MSNKREVSFWWPCLWLYFIALASCQTDERLKDIAKAIRETSCAVHRGEK